MKLYFFYKLRAGLEPQFYAYTDKKDYAEMFNSIRQHFYMKEMEVPEKTFKNLKLTHPDMLLLLHEFRTQNTVKFGSSKVLQTATGFEIQNIILHKEDILFQLLGNTYLPSDIFKKEYKDAFDELGYTSFKNYAALDFQSMGSPRKDFLEEGFEVDELSLFIVKYVYDGDVLGLL